MGAQYGLPFLPTAQALNNADHVVEFGFKQ
jgi:hypothetical protein